MSQQIKNLKEQIQRAFSDVESADYLEKQVLKSKLRFSESFVVNMNKNPKANFREWSEKLIETFNIHSTVAQESQVIGISLLALDALEHDITDVYVKFINETLKQD